MPDCRKRLKRLVDQAVPATWRSLAAAGLPVRKCTDEAPAPPDLTQSALERVGLHQPLRPLNDARTHMLREYRMTR